MPCFLIHIVYATTERKIIFVNAYVNMDQLVKWSKLCLIYVLNLGSSPNPTHHRFWATYKKTASIESGDAGQDST